jgi:hypothetical protein
MKLPLALGKIHNHIDITDTTSAAFAPLYPQLLDIVRHL